MSRTHSGPARAPQSRRRSNRDSAIPSNRRPMHPVPGFGMTEPAHNVGCDASTVEWHNEHWIPRDMRDPEGHECAVRVEFARDADDRIQSEKRESDRGIIEVDAALFDLLQYDGSERFD